MSFTFSVDTATAGGEIPRFARAAPPGVSSGALGYSAGGPAWLDAYHSKRPPTPVDLVNAFKAVAFACVRLNQTGLSKPQLRLYATTKAGQRKPRRSYREVPVDRQRFLRGKVARDDRAYSWSRTDLARNLGDGDEVHEVTDSPFLDVLQKPNPFFTYIDFISYIAACLDVTGSAFLAPTRPVGQDGTQDVTWAPTELWPLQPQYVFPVKGTNGEILRSWRYFSEDFAPHEVVRARHMSVRDPYLSAFAPLHACFEQIGLIDYYTASLEGILKGGAMPAGIVGPSDPKQMWGEAEADRLDADINNKQTGPYKGRWWVARQAYTVTPLTFAPTDLGGLELTKEQRLLVANCFDVPISLLQTEDSNRATARESTHQHQYYAIAPRCCMIDSALTWGLVKPVDERQFFAFDNPVDRDRDSEAKVFDLAVRNNTWTINEVRHEHGKEPVEWGDMPFSPMASDEPDGDEAGEAKGGKGKAGMAAEKVQETALNGAQVTSLVEIVTQIKAGIIPPESAKALLAAAFPALSQDEINRIVDPVKVEPEVVNPPPVAPPPGAGPFGKKPPAAKPEAEPAEDAERSALYRRLDAVLTSIERTLPAAPETFA